MTAGIGHWRGLEGVEGQTLEVTFTRGAAADLLASQASRDLFAVLRRFARSY